MIRRMKHKLTDLIWTLTDIETVSNEAGWYKATDQLGYTSIVLFVKDDLKNFIEVKDV